MRAMGTLSAQLADSERAGRALEQQLASTLLEKNELRDRIQAVNAQVAIAVLLLGWLIIIYMHALYTYIIHIIKWILQFIASIRAFLICSSNSWSLIKRVMRT